MIYLLLLFLPFKPLSQFEANPVSKVFYDEKGELLQVTALEDGSRCEYTGWSKLPAPVKKIFIKAEDKRFYFHDGVDLFALANAAIQNARNKKIVRGGSTITMQLVKMITKDRQVKLSRKLNDIFFLEHLASIRWA